jgi:hypothetical protein
MKLFMAIDYASFSKTFHQAVRIIIKRMKFYSKQTGTLIEAIHDENSVSIASYFRSHPRICQLKSK